MNLRGNVEGNMEEVGENRAGGQEMIKLNFYYKDTNKKV